MEEFSEEKYPYQCNSCPLKFSDMESANAHFLDGHEKQKEVEIEELPQVVGQIFKAPSKVKKSGSSENKVIYERVLSTGQVQFHLLSDLPIV
jgi:hypothetical protein